MILLNHLSTYITNSKNITNYLLEKINNNGFEKSAFNQSEVMKNNNFQSIKENEISAIDKINSFGDHYDSLLSSIETYIDKFKVKTLEKQNVANENNQEPFNIELKSIVASIESVLDTKIGKEKLFNISTSLVIGDGIESPKTYSKEWMYYENEPIKNTLEKFINGTEKNVDILDNILEMVGERHTEIGARQAVLKNTKSFYQNLQKNENEYVGRLYKLEETLIDFNQETLKYETLSKMVQRISSLSLVNYI